MSVRGQLFVISGPSGVGKGPLVNMLLERVDGIALSISATTRPPRSGDQEGVDYYFLDDEQFDALLANDGFLEWANVHGRRYGTLLAEVERILDLGQDLILEIDTQGNEQVKKRMPQAVSIFVAPPSLAELESRLRLRATEDYAEISRRLQTAKFELQAKDRYNVVIENADLNAAAAELVRVIEDDRRARQQV